MNPVLKIVLALNAIVLTFITLVLCYVVIFVLSTREQPVTNLPTPLPTAMPFATNTVIAHLPTNTPIPPPSATLAPLPTATETPTLPPTLTPTPLIPVVVADTTVNVRSGPGLTYPVIGSLTPNAPVRATAQNATLTWWVIHLPDGSIGWVSASVVQAQHTDNLPLATAPPVPATPTPAATPTPLATPTPAYQFSPTGWFDDFNPGLTRFMGNISDAQGNPVNGVFIEAQCGSYRIISNPSGPVGWGPFNESHTWAPGFYDITVDRRAIPCKWLLTVVATEDRETVLARLSETVEIETTANKSIVVANWRKNW